MNDTTREQWVNNDEGLYDMWKQSKKYLQAFVRSNRSTIDEVIDNVTNGKKSAHYPKGQVKC